MGCNPVLLLEKLATSIDLCGTLGVKRKKKGGAQFECFVLETNLALTYFAETEIRNSRYCYSLFVKII